MEPQTEQPNNISELNPNAPLVEPIFNIESYLPNLLKETSIIRRGDEFSFKTLEIRGGNVMLSNFTPILKLKSVQVYISDGVTPNGVLPGVRGDICLNADSGKAYYCSTTGTTWTAF